ncbi:MAG: pitrilysin family protein [Candidatus Zixiibacteriota bacterium]
MKSLIMILIIVAALCCSVAASPTVDVTKLQYPRLNDIEIPKITRHTLGNGLRLYLVEDHELPLFRMSVRINCGGFMEPADKIGLVAILGQTLRTGGTTTRTGDALDELLESIGGSVETFGGITTCGASVSVLSEHTDLGLEVLSDILQNPVFDPDKIELAKVAHRSGISRRNDQPQQIVSREFAKLIYGAESPYARHTEYATIEAISRDDLVAFHRAWFHPENVQMAIWGDFDPKKLVKQVEKLFGKWPRGSSPVPPLPKVTYKYKQQVYLVDKADLNQAQVIIGHIGGLLTDRDYADRIVMNTIMGVGFGSRMVDAVRSREGLAYSTSSAFGANVDRPGVFTSYAATKSGSTAKAIREMIKVVRSMQTDPPTVDELKTGKDSYLNSFVFQFDTRAEVVNRIMDYDFYGLPNDFLQQVKARVESVTADDIIDAAKRNLKPDSLIIMVVGNPNDFDEPLDSLGLGPVERIDIAIRQAEAHGGSR